MAACSGARTGERHPPKSDPGSSDIGALAIDLQRYTLTLETHGDRPQPYHVTGDTFRHKEHLKRAGGVWSRYDQAWRFPTRTHLETLLALLDGRPGRPQGLAEAPTTYDRAPQRPPANGATSTTTATASACAPASWNPAPTRSPTTS